MFYTTKEYTVKDYHLLKLESQHLDLLLNLLRGKVSMESYIREYNSLFSNESFYDFPDEHVVPLLSLEKEEIDIGLILANENVHCFINILQICSDNIKNHIKDKNYVAIKDEIYYNHNVPSLISTQNRDLIEYYLSTECPECIRLCPKEMVQCYEEAWQEVRKQFPNHNKTNKTNSSSSKKQGLFSKLFKK